MVFTGITNHAIDRVVRAYQLKEGAQLVPRWCLRWSINLAALALVEFLLGALFSFVRGRHVQGASVASAGFGWLMVYAVWLAICYFMVYQSQTNVFQAIYRRPFWRPLEVLHRTFPIVMIMFVSVLGNVVGIVVAVSCLIGSETA